jgi:twitching motility protein PilT
MIVHGLLDLVVAQGADALILQADRPPTLLRAGVDVPLSMPPLAQDFFDELRRELEGQTEVEVQGQRFEVAAEAGRLVLRRPGKTEPSSPPAVDAAPASAPPTTPAPAAPSAFSTWLAESRRLEASDVFFSSGRPPFVRRGGDVQALDNHAVDAASIRTFVSSLLSPEALSRLETHGSADVGWEDGGTRYRVHAFEQMDGLSLALRPIRTDPPNLHALGLPESFHRLTQYRNGLVLMTGMAGSGKSTTLVALLERLCRTSAKHIITLEDPIEYRFQASTALLHQRELGTHVSSFAEGLRAAMREAPDIILLGEMRDPETIAAALTAAETGHLVLSTLHCANSATAIDRIVDAFEEHRHSQVRSQLASVLRAVVSQSLLVSTRPPRRVPAYELLLVNTAVASKIREGRGHQLRSELHPGRSEGMIPLEASLDDLVARGEITREQARQVAPNPSLLSR